MGDAGAVWVPGADPVVGDSMVGVGGAGMLARAPTGETLWHLPCWWPRGRHSRRAKRGERVQGSGGGRQARLGGAQGEGGLVLDGVGTVLPLSQEGKQMVWAKCGQGDDLRWESGARPVEASGSQ